MRPEMVENGLKFLRHPNVQATPLSERVSFLEQKGMTKEEIQEAIEQYQRDPTPSAPAPTVTPVAQAVGAAAPMVVAAAAPVQQLMQRRARMPTYLRVILTISSVVGVATILGFVWQYLLSAGYFPWLRPSRPMLEAAKTPEETEEEKEKEATLLASLQNVSTAIQSQTEELTKLCSAMGKKEDELLTRQRASSHISSAIAEQSTVQAIAELKAEVSTLKALLLSKETAAGVTVSATNAQTAKSTATATPVATAATTSAPTSTSPTASLPSMQQAALLKETPAQRMENALKKFRQENPMDQLKLASGILIMYVKNLVENPDVPRYRRIAPANANFKQKIEPLKHHDELLKSVGFESTGLNMEWKWHLLNRENGEFDEHLAILKALLKALQAVAASRTNDPIALEEIAHQSLVEFRQQRDEQQKDAAASVDANVDAASASTVSSAATSSAPTPSSLIAQRKADTDLQAFLTRLEQKTAKTWEEKTTPTTTTSTTTSVDATPAPAVEPATASEPVAAVEVVAAEASGPAYPKSFTEVMEMLKKGETVPGIQEIEDRVSDDAAKFLSEKAELPSTAKSVPVKPWEKR